MRVVRVGGMTIPCARSGRALPMATRTRPRRRGWRTAVILVAALCGTTVGLGSAIAGGVPAPPTKDVAYGDDELQKLDVYPAAAGLVAPVVVVVHGGGWFTGDKSTVVTMAESLSAHGFVVFNINYRLSVGPPNTAGSVPGVPMQTDDLAAAVDWIIAEGGVYGADVSRISLIGGSSGAQVVALGGQLINQAAPGTIRSVVVMSGPTDFDTLVHPNGPGSLNLDIGDGMPAYLGCPVADCTEGQLRGPSPRYNISASNPAFMLVNGDAEMNPVQQAVVLHDALSVAGESSILDIVTGKAGKKHGFFLYPSEETEIVQFLSTVEAPTFTVDDVSLAEGNSGTVQMTFTVTLTGVEELNRPMTVDYVTGDGTATAGSDYLATSGTLSFSSGPTPQTQTVSVSINGDTTVEADETVLINLSRPENTTISDAQGQGTIVNDDHGDVTPPTVTKKTPNANAKGAAVTTNVTVTFNEPVRGVDGTTFTLKDPAGTLVSADVTYNASTGVATLNPVVSLAKDTWYTATIFGGPSGTHDLQGNPLATTTWTFLTGPKPKVTGKAPKAGAVDVSRTANVTATFNEQVAAVSGTTLTLASGTGAVAAEVSRNGTTNQWILDPHEQLAANTTYTVTVTGGRLAIRDLVGNPLVTTTWTFTTGA